MICGLTFGEVDIHILVEVRPRIHCNHKYLWVVPARKTFWSHFVIVPELPCVIEVNLAVIGIPVETLKEFGFAGWAFSVKLSATCSAMYILI